MKERNRLFDQYPREYNSFNGAKQRVTNPNRIDHKYYKDVKFTFTSFKEFIELLGPAPEGATLDRINPRGDYAPGNVRWADRKDQMRNRRDNVKMTYQGQTKLLIEWCEQTGVKYGTALTRYKEFGMPPHQVLYPGDLRK